MIKPASILSSRKNWVMDDPPSPEMNSEPKKKIIAAKNILFGTGYFLILSLPEGWRVVRTYLDPDIHSTVTRGNITWIEAGQTDQIVYHPGKNIALDLMIQIKRGKHNGPEDKGVQKSAEGSKTVAGHPAQYVIGEVKQGFLRRKSAKTMRFCYYCPEKNHTFFVHFTGKCPEADLMEIYESFADSECH